MPTITRPLTAIAETTPREWATAMIALVAILLSLVTMFVLNLSLVIAAGFFSILVSVYSVWQQRQLTDITAMKETYDALTHEVDRLAEQNMRLKENVTALSDGVDRLTALENALGTISNSHGNSVAQLADQVQQSRDNLEQLQRNVKNEIAQNLLTVIMSSDSDGNAEIDSSEVKELVQRLQSIYGTPINEQQMHGAISKEGCGSFDSVYSFIQDVMVSNSFPNGTNNEDRNGRGRVE